MIWTAQWENDAPGAVRARLLTPASEVTIEELADVWFVETLELTIKGYGGLAADPGLPGRIRGAFGQALMAGASAEALAGQPCPFDPPCAFEALFRKQGRMTRGLDFPSPWVIGAAARGGDLLVSLSLFGFAADWTAAATEAFTRAARELVDWKGRSAIFLPRLEFAGRTLRNVSGVDFPRSPQAVDIEFVSPLVSGAADPREHPESLLTTGLGTRLSGLARWHDLSLDACCDWRAIKSAASGFQYTFENVEEVKWRRGSERQNRKIPMRGVLGCLRMSGNLAPLAAALALGETCHMGGDVAFGCGRYNVLQWYGG